MDCTSSSVLGYGTGFGTARRKRLRFRCLTRQSAHPPRGAASRPRAASTRLRKPARDMPRPESNQRTRFRKPLPYPLSYGGPGRRVAPSRARATTGLPSVPRAVDVAPTCRTEVSRLRQCCSYVKAGLAFSVLKTVRALGQLPRKSRRGLRRYQLVQHERPLKLELGQLPARLGRRKGREGQLCRKWRRQAGLPSVLEPP